MKISKSLFYILIFLAILTAGYYAYRRAPAAAAAATEGFIQDSPYTLKRGEKAYDRFYSKLYNDLYFSADRNKYQIDAIVDSTMPTARNSVFLDTGCGTGEIIKELKSRGYKAYGVDRSRPMIRIATENCKRCRGFDEDGEKIIKDGDFIDPMTFDAGIFTHVLCLNGTLYEVKQKPEFFKNVYHWLMRSGYFVVHLVSRHKYTEATQKELELRGIEYTSTAAAKDDEDSSQVLIKEVFKDKQTGNVRENERTLYVEELTDLVNLIKATGFNVHAIIDMKPVNDKYEYIYIFSKI